MTDPKAQITQLAHIMQEFGLEDAKLKTDGFLVEFRRNAKPSAVPEVVTAAPTKATKNPAPNKKAAPEVKGIPITSPMTGIVYTSPSPNDPPFIKVGDVVAPGQTIALIEAMKVFNDVTANIGGTIKKINVESGQLVQMGEVLVVVE